MNIKKIQGKFDSKEAYFFLGRPRIFMKIACRGGDYSNDSRYRSSLRPQKLLIFDKDFFTISTTIRKSIKDSLSIGKGASIEALVELLKNDKERKNRLDDVVRALSLKVGEKTDGRECVERRTILSKILYLCKKGEDIKDWKKQNPNVLDERKHKENFSSYSSSSQGWKCGNCTFSNPQRAKFCSECGTSQANLKTSPNKPPIQSSSPFTCPSPITRTKIKTSRGSYDVVGQLGFKIMIPNPENDS